jgi:hypothetical protein
VPAASASIQPILEIFPVQMITLALAAQAGHEPIRIGQQSNQDMSHSISRNTHVVSTCMVTFFMMSLLTNILAPIASDVIKGLNVSLAAAALLPFSFFIAAVQPTM